MKRIEKLKTKYLIVGAGCSGLAFANNCNKDDYLILEKDSKAGGYCKTIYQGPYVWDYAGHFFHFATDYWKEYFESRIDREALVTVEKNTKIYYKSELIDYPFQKNIHQLPKQEFIECLYDLFFKEEKDSYSSFKQMLYGKFGRSISEKFLIPYNEKLYACDLDELDCDAMGRFFPYANIDDIISNMIVKENSSYNGSFLYPKKGAETFINALLRDLDNNRILYNEELLEIDKASRTVKTSNYIIEYEHLINTIPFKELLKITESDDYESVLGCNKVLVFNLGFDKKSSAYNGIHWVYIPDKSINFYRIGFYDNILNQDRLSMYIEIGYSANEAINIEAQLDATLENLRKIGVITDHKLLEEWHCIMDPAYVYLSDDARSLVNTKTKELEEQGIYTIGRYGAWKYCSIEDCLIDASNLFERVNSI